MALETRSMHGYKPDISTDQMLGGDDHLRSAVHAKFFDDLRDMGFGRCFSCSQLDTYLLIGHSLVQKFQHNALFFGDLVKRGASFANRIKGLVRIEIFT